MISDIYILAMTLYNPYEGEGPFSGFVETEFPTCIKGNLPKHINFISIEYKKDEVINSLLYSFVEQLVSDGLEDFLNRINLELGYFHLRLESREDVRRKELPAVEFVLQKLHEEYCFISTYFFYLTESKLKSFVKMWTYESDCESEEDDYRLDTSHYIELIDSYFYESVIPDQYLDGIAKLFLLRDPA